MIAQDAADIAIRHGEALPEFAKEIGNMLTGAARRQVDGVEALTADTGEAATQ